MSNIVYLTTDQVALINEQQFGGSVRDWDTLDAATMRCAHSYGGTEFYPTLLDKAAALLYGLTTTQAFVDGNKRTAWAAMETFLALNGEFIDSSTVDAYVLVMAIANRLVEHDEIVEWLTEHRRN